MEIESKALTVVEQAKGLTVKDSDSYKIGAELWKTTKDMSKKIKESFDPIIEKAHQSHKEAIAQRDKILKPVENAGKEIKKALEKYDAEQEQIRREKERELQEQLRKQEEERQLQEAIAAEKAGDTETAEAIMNEPVVEHIVTVQKEIPKVENAPVFRTIWKAKVFDLMALVKAVAEGRVSIMAIQANEIFLGQQARSLKETMNIEGVKAYSERV